MDEFQECCLTGLTGRNLAPRLDRYRQGEREREPGNTKETERKGEIPASSEQLFVMGVYTSVVMLERQRDISKSHEDVKLPNKMVKYVI